jgi:hypothetical protein
MNKVFYHIAFLVFLTAGGIVHADDAFPIVEPGAASMEISKLLADAKADEASAALEKALPPMPSTQFNFEQLRTAFKLLSKNGPADVVDEVSSKKYGDSVHVIMHYVHFPRQDMPVNQFVFLRYTFMKGKEGWMMTTFDFKTSGIFPPPGWSD